MTDSELQAAAKKANAAYHRRYRAEHPEKMREIRVRYWAKKTAEAEKEKVKEREKENDQKK